MIWSQKGAACGLLDAVLGGGDGEAAVVRPGTVLDVEAARRPGPVVLHRVASGDLVAMVQDTALHMAVLVLLETHLDHSIPLQLTGFAAQHRHRGVLPQVDQLIVARDHGRKLALRHETAPIQHVHAAVRQHLSVLLQKSSHHAN